MERILALYALPYDPHYPVICSDERPCLLIGDALVPAAMQPGKPRKQRYEYEKLGSCALLAAIEPLTGKRLAQARPQRTKRAYTLFCQALAAQYPNAIKIRLVQDSLNPHNAGAFDEHVPAEDAFALAERFAFISTPKSASWLTMIACECAVISRLCLNRRIPSLQTLGREVLALFHERSAKAIKINWQFSIQAARTKLNSHSTKIHPENEKPTFRTL